MPDPLSPLDWSVGRAVLDRMLTLTSALGGYATLPGVQRAMLRKGRLYFDTSLMQWEVYDGFGVSPASCNQLLGGHQGEIRVPEPTPRRRLDWMRRSMRFALRSAWPRLRAKATLARALRHAADERVRRWVPDDRVELARRMRAHVCRMRGADDLFLLQAAGSALFALLAWVEKYCPGEGQALTAALMAGGTPSVTAAQGYELMALARIAASDPGALAWLRRTDRAGASWSQELAQDSPFRHAFAAFLDRYGHRAVYESYLRNPRWREAPDYLLDSVVQLLDCDPARLRERQRHASRQARERVARAMPIAYRPMLSLLVNLATAERNVREGARSALTAYGEQVRRDALALGESLVGPAWQRPEDVFNLTLDELWALAEDRLPAAAAARRAAWRSRQLDGYMHNADAEVVVEGPDGIPAAVSGHGPARTDADSWRGVTVGSGQASGPAHVARHPTQTLSMQSGAVLVTPSTDPSWTPAFLKAGALVMETGGYLSHGAIVAREFGIPAVVNLPGILDAIRQGEPLEVDGNRGEVRRLPDAVGIAP
jgi:pyruvate,water dikinase